MAIIKRNEGFICVVCNRDIPPATQTCRNHCPQCFASLHVDGEIPGDRNTTCHGIMYPFEYQLKHSEYRIHFECKKCKKQHWNRLADDDDFGGLEMAVKKGKEMLI